MAVTAQRWSQRLAAQEAGISRAAVLTAISEGLVAPGDLDLADVLVLRATSAVRTLLFPGETQPANSARSVRPRDRKLAEKCRDLVAAQLAGDPTHDATALVYADHVSIPGDYAKLVGEVHSAQSAGHMFVFLPLGTWLTNLNRGEPMA